MEALTRLVTDSLARHGFDRPVDPRRLQWSRWFSCDSPRSLLMVPSKPGIFAIAEEIMDLGPVNVDVGTTGNVGTAAPCPPAEQNSTAVSTKRMLAVIQFSEDDDMAFTLDRMFTCVNPMRARLSSGRCFLRFVVIEDQDQRRNICSALNQWMLSSAEKATGFPAAFSSSLELNSVARMPSPASAESIATPVAPVGPDPQADPITSLPHLDSGANKNLHCSQALPSGF
jgi:hypothetical protein